MVSNSSSQDTTSCLPQPHPSVPELSPTGMYSMKRTCSGPVDGELRRTPGSPGRRLRTATALIFTGLKPASSAASMPSSVCCSSPATRDLAGTGRGQACRAICSRARARRSSGHRPCGAEAPRSWSWRRSRCPGRPRCRAPGRPRPVRTSGSPPVRRTLRMPMSAATRTACDDLLDAQDLLMRELLHALLWHAVDAPEVAAVRERYPEIVDDAAMRVFHMPPLSILSEYSIGHAP